MPTFAQGDLERERGLEFSPLCDRKAEKCPRCSCQTHHTDKKKTDYLLHKEMLKYSLQGKFNSTHCNPFRLALVLNLALAPSWVWLGQLLKIKCVHSRVNVNILASTCVPFRPVTVQVPNLSLTWHETDNSTWRKVSYYMRKWAMFRNVQKETMLKDFHGFFATPSPSLQPAGGGIPVTPTQSF
jgi:hypothetical protein